MPSSMIHLLTAYKYNPDATGAFWVGNIAPDSVMDRKAKDAIHFRDKADRLGALRKQAVTMDVADEYSRGILLHLFLDYCWDTEPVREYKANYSGDSWFRDYRREIALAGAWLYHHTGWSKSVWNEMVSCPHTVFDNNTEFVKEDVIWFIDMSTKWHRDNNIGPSSVFTPRFVEEFTDRVAEEYQAWLHTVTPGG